MAVSKRLLAALASGGVLAGGATALAHTPSGATSAPLGAAAPGRVAAPGRAGTAGHGAAGSAEQQLVAETGQLQAAVVTARNQLQALQQQASAQDGQAQAGIDAERQQLAGEQSQLAAERQQLAGEAASLQQQATQIAAARQQAPVPPTHATTGASSTKGDDGGGDG